MKTNQTYKARLVARGWNQEPRQDCGSTFALVCRLQSVRMVIAIAAVMDWEVRQLDKETAFLYADIEKEVFVAEQPGFETNDNEKGLLVIKLGKSLYGLAQSPGNCFHTIDAVLISIGFVPFKSDKCMYIYNHDGVIIVFTLYVDHRLVIRGSVQLLEKIRSKLTEKFKMTDMGDISLMLGMQITRAREKKTFTISQEYTTSILERFGMANCKPVGAPGFG